MCVSKMCVKVYDCICVRLCVYPPTPADARGSASRITGFCLCNCECNCNCSNCSNCSSNNKNNNNNNNNNNNTLGSRRYVSEDTLGIFGRVFGICSSDRDTLVCCPAGVFFRAVREKNNKSNHASSSSSNSSWAPRPKLMEKTELRGRNW